METYTWNYEGNEKKLEIYTNFLRYGNQVFMDGEYEIMEISPNNQILLLNRKDSQPKFTIPFETEAQAKEVMDLLLRTWYPDCFDYELPPELTPKQYAMVREVVRKEIGQMGEEVRLAVRGACANSCGRLATFGQYLLGRAFHHATQFGVGIWNGVEDWWHGPEAAFAREQQQEAEVAPGTREHQD